MTLYSLQVSKKKKREIKTYSMRKRGREKAVLRMAVNGSCPSA